MAPTAAQRLRDLVEEIELADQVGLDVFGVGEHHHPDCAISAPAADPARRRRQPAVLHARWHARPSLAIGINSRAYVAEASQQAADESFGAYAMMNRIERERGWGPLGRSQFDQCARCVARW